MLFTFHIARSNNLDSIAPVEYLLSIMSLDGWSQLFSTFDQTMSYSQHYVPIVQCGWL